MSFTGHQDRVGALEGLLFRKSPQMGKDLFFPTALRWMKMKMRMLVWMGLKVLRLHMTWMSHGQAFKACLMMTMNLSSSLLRRTLLHQQMYLFLVMLSNRLGTLQQPD